MSGPLAGRVIVVTRPRDTAGSLADGIRARGGVPILCPAIRVELVDAGAVRRAIGRLSGYRWLVVTSANAVRSIAPILEGETVSCRIAAVGRATVAALTACGCTAEVVPDRSTGAALLAALEPRVNAGERVLVPQSDLADTAVADGLARAGCEVVRVVSYRTVVGDGADMCELRRVLRERTPDAVTFASPSAVRGLRALLGVEEFERLAARSAVLSIGPTTSASLAALGVPVAREADPHDTGGLLAALEVLLAGMER